MPRRLESALAEGMDMRESLRRLSPPQPEYGLMKYWLSEYRNLFARGGWPVIPTGPTLGPGGRGERVSRLCRRLQDGGDMPGNACPDTFSADLEEALRVFHARHGLEPTGMAGQTDLEQLNVPVEHRILQIKLNLECWRWLPQDLGRRHVRVNIADFRLVAHENGRETLAMKVVIGSKQDRTPVFSDHMMALTLNPAWHVPPSIAREEILPELRKDAGYLAKHDMELLPGGSEDAIPIRPESVDWSAVTDGNFRYRVRQRPGAGSALGRIKFVLTNPFHIYLHDTPSPAYFQRHERALSHGCVRVEKPMDLAVWALGPEPGWDLERLRKEIAKGGTADLPLPRGGIPVHILYWTAFVDNQGKLNFRRDIYGWDRALEKALAEKAAHF